MKMTDRKAIQLLKRANCCELDESIRTYPEDEKDNRTDLDILREELDYLIEMYEEDGTIFSNDLAEAQRILKETKNGKMIPLILPEVRPKYPKYRIEIAKKTVNEYRRLKRMQGTF